MNAICHMQNCNVMRNISTILPVNKIIFCKIFDVRLMFEAAFN